MMTSSVIYDVISFFVTMKCQKCENNWWKQITLTKNILISSESLEIFRKVVTYNNIKSHKKTEFHSLFTKISQNIHEIFR